MTRFQFNFKMVYYNLLKHLLIVILKFFSKSPYLVKMYFMEKVLFEFTAAIHPDPVVTWFKACS